MSKLKELGYKRNREEVEAAYTAFINKESESEGRLLQVVTAFASKKITSATYDLQESDKNADDCAQEVALYVWGKLDGFKGNAPDFYAWLHRICYTKGATSYNEKTEKSNKHVPLQLENEDGDVEDNPLIYKERKPEHSRELPDWIQGTDLWICHLIRENMTYAQIGESLNISENAVEKRIAKMRERNIEEAKNSGRVKKVRVKGKWVNAIGQDGGEEN